MNDFIITHGSELLIGLFTVLGTLVGVLVTTIYNYFKDRKKRKDRYFFTMIEERFEVYSETFYWCEKLKHLVHDEESERYKNTREARDWYARNNLYLEPNIRYDFLKFIKNVELYKNELELYRQSGRSKGFNSEETKKKYSKLQANFEDIMVGVQNRIQEKIDIYYKNLGNNAI